MPKPIGLTAPCPLIILLTLALIGVEGGENDWEGVGCVAGLSGEAMSESGLPPALVDDVR
jgi:hypothetical protein